MAARVPGLDTLNENSEAMMRPMPKRAAMLLPALLALESLAVLALGWGVYRRLSPVEIGPPLSPLTEFTFNDQLVWGLAVGATLCLLPAFVEGRSAGYNLLLFFGALYLIRGIGILGMDSPRKVHIHRDTGADTSGFCDSDPRPRPRRYMARPPQARQSSVTVWLDPVLC
jgi:hypothetical protein